jgi:hypothetical protein
VQSKHQVSGNVELPRLTFSQPAINHSGLSSGGFAGIVVAALVVIFLVVAGIYYKVVTARQRTKENTSSNRNGVQFSDNEVFNALGRASSAPLGEGAGNGGSVHTPKGEDNL